VAGAGVAADRVLDDHSKVIGNRAPLTLRTPLDLRPYLRFETNRCRTKILHRAPHPGAMMPIASQWRNVPKRAMHNSGRRLRNMLALLKEIPDPDVLTSLSIEELVRRLSRRARTMQSEAAFADY
jgi:hypothetical protein